MKYVLLTGGAGGLGEICARALAANGFMVFAADINEEALAEIGKTENIIPLKVDITDQASIDEAKRMVKEHTDTLHAVINFAGIHTLCSMIEGACSETIERMLRVNVMGMVRINRTFIDLVMAGGGRIINCSSECGYLKPQPFNGPYTMTKYAVEAYNDSLRRELMFLGVPVIKIQPGSFKTNMHKSAASGFEKIAENTQHYSKILTTMKPMMDFEFKMANDPKYIVDAVLKAVEKEHPHMRYRVKNSKLLRSLELIPDPVLDLAYRLIMH